MELFHNLVLGFDIAFSPLNLAYCLVGALLGTLVGILPGLNPLVAISMLLPLTFRIPPTAALIMLSGVYYGAHHAGSTTAIMLNMPGEPSSLVICLDGHPMARKGRAGAALCISALGSFFAGTVCILFITLFSPPLANAALSFQAPEYTSAVILALIGSSVLVSRSLLTTLGMSALGVLLGTVGTDVNSGAIRFTFGANELTNGVDFVPVAVGLFAIAEIGSRLGLPEVHKRIDTRIRGLVPTWNDLRASFGPVLRGTGLGAVLGVLPGTGPLICAFGSYAIERKLSRHPENFGRGAIEGVAGPEAANNAAAFTHFIPMLTLGIPAGATMALMLGALMIQGIAPGPQVMSLHPDLFWGLVASMWLGNLMLLVLNLPLIGIWIRLLSIPYRFLYPVILVFCCIGAYSINNSAFDVGIAACIGALGYFLHRMDCPPAPLILGLVLGPMLEDNLRRSLLISNGDPLVFFERPISLGLLLLTCTLVAVFSLPVFMPNKRQREQASLLGDEAKAHTDISEGG